MSDKEIAQENKLEYDSIEFIIKKFQQKNTTVLSIRNYHGQICIGINDYEFIGISIRMLKKLFEAVEFKQLNLIGFVSIPKWLQYIISQFRGKLCYGRIKALKDILNTILLIRELKFILDEQIELEILEELLGCVLVGKINLLTIFLKRDMYLIAENIMRFAEFLNINVGLQRQLEAYDVYEITKIE